MAPPISQLNTGSVILVTRPEAEPPKPAAPGLSKTASSEAVSKLAHLENSRADEIKQTWMQWMTDRLDHAQGFVEGFNAFTVIKDIGYDYLKIPRSQKYWEGRIDGGHVAMIVDLAMMSGGTGAAVGSLECAMTTLGFCVPVAGPGAAIGGAVALAGVGLYGIHGDNLEKAKEQYAESRAKEPASSSSKATETPPEPRKVNPSKAESPVWKELKPYREDIKTNGLTGKKIEYYQWDHTHQEIEVYGANRMHKGVKDPLTGELIKDAVPGRRIKF